jgi:hypothetical protein
MGGVTNDAAVLAIRQSCLAISSAALPLGTVMGMYNTITVSYFPAHNSMYIRFVNNTSLTITSITFAIERKADSRSREYAVSDFYPLPDYQTLPPGVISIKPVGDPLVGHMIRPGETRDFEYRINEVPTAPTLFFQEFDVHIMSAHGF